MIDRSVHYIYVLKDPETLQVRYVGQSYNVRYRANRHVHDALRKRDQGHSLLLKDAWLIGLNDRNLWPIHEAICSATTKDEIDRLEIYWIDHYNKKSDGTLFNILPGGGLVFGPAISAETRKKISISKKGRKASSAEMAHILRLASIRKGQKLGPMHPNTRAAITGRVKTTEERIKLSKANKGKTVSPESIARMSAAQKAIPPEIRKTMGNKKGWKPNREIVERAAAKNRGKKRSAEHIAIIRATHTGKFVSIETRKKIAAGRWGNLNYSPEVKD